MHSRAPAEPDVTAFEATVDRVDGRTVVLDETFFYPESGGQPADRGVLAGVEVSHVRETDGEVVHDLATSPDVAPGETVEAAIDPDFRTYCRRAHSASHALYGAARRLFDDLGYGGFGIDAEKVRVDLSTPTLVDDAAVVELERLVNRAVWDSLPVTWEQVPRDEALAREDVAFNSATEEGVTDAKEVRLVEIEGWDVAACGGTHVTNTREIGPVTVLDRSNPGEGLTRITFAVGPAGIDRRASEAGAAREAAATLDVPVTGLDDGVGNLVDERERLHDQVEDLRAQVITARLADLVDATVTRDGREWLVGTVPSTDANALGEFAQRVVDQAADVVALVGQNGEYLAVATAGDVDADAVVDRVTTEFGGGGGGSGTVAQAGGLDGDAEEIVAFLRE
jgi:alanyl-tRNA synthetase